MVTSACCALLPADVGLSWLWELDDLPSKAAQPRNPRSVWRHGIDPERTPSPLASCFADPPTPSKPSSAPRRYHLKASRSWDRRPGSGKGGGSGSPSKPLPHTRRKLQKHVSKRTVFELEGPASNLPPLQLCRGLGVDAALERHRKAGLELAKYRRACATEQAAKDREHAVEKCRLEATPPWKEHTWMGDSPPHYSRGSTIVMHEGALSHVPTGNLAEPRQQQLQFDEDISSTPWSRSSPGSGGMVRPSLMKLSSSRSKGVDEEHPHAGLENGNGSRAASIESPTRVQEPLVKTFTWVGPKDIAFGYRMTKLRNALQNRHSQKVHTVTPMEAVPKRGMQWLRDERIETFKSWSEEERLRMINAFHVGKPSRADALDSLGVCRALAELGLVPKNAQERDEIGSIIKDASLHGRSDLYEFVFHIVPQIERRLDELRSPALRAKYNEVNRYGDGLAETCCRDAVEELLPSPADAKTRSILLENSFPRIFASCARSGIVDFFGFEAVVQAMDAEQTRLSSLLEKRVAASARLPAEVEEAHLGELTELQCIFDDASDPKLGGVECGKLATLFMDSGLGPVVGDTHAKMLSMEAGAQAGAAVGFQGFVEVIDMVRESETSECSRAITMYIENSHREGAIRPRDIPSLLLQMSLCPDCQRGDLEEVHETIEVCDDIEDIDMGELADLMYRYKLRARKVARKREHSLGLSLGFTEEEVSQLRRSFSALCSGSSTQRVGLRELRLFLQALNAECSLSNGELQQAILELSWAGREHELPAGGRRRVIKRLASNSTAVSVFSAFSRQTSLSELSTPKSTRSRLRPKKRIAKKGTARASIASNKRRDDGSKGGATAPQEQAEPEAPEPTQQPSPPPVTHPDEEAAPSIEAPPPLPEDEGSRQGGGRRHIRLTIDTSANCLRGGNDKTSAAPVAAAGDSAPAPPAAGDSASVPPAPGDSAPAPLAATAAEDDEASVPAAPAESQDAGADVGPSSAQKVAVQEDESDAASTLSSDVEDLVHDHSSFSDFRKSRVSFQTMDPELHFDAFLRLAALIIGKLPVPD